MPEHMKLFRFGEPGSEQPGLIDAAGTARSVAHLGLNYDERFFANGQLAELMERSQVESASWPELNLRRERLGAPVARPSKLIGVGLNYREHVKETGARTPSEPKIFMKATTAICGVTDDVLLPEGAEQLDYEVELAVVMGQLARRVSPQQARATVAGYTVCNDYSERDWQKNRAGQFVKGKSHDTFAPLGPYLVTSDEFSPNAARLWCSVGGEMRQDGTTADMIFDVATIVSSISHYMTLLPGDVITTGTPSGVGLGRVPPVFLKPGDVVRYGIEGVGEGQQTICAAE